MIIDESMRYEVSHIHLSVARGCDPVDDLHLLTGVPEEYQRDELIRYRLFSEIDRDLVLIPDGGIFLV